MKQELVLEQRQSLRLSQEMKLSFRILEMSQEELFDYWKVCANGSYLSGEDSFLEALPLEKNFYQHLEEQLLYFNISEKRKEDMLYCIYNLNQSGYLTLSDEDLKRERKLSEKELREVYACLHRLEPIGVGAHNLQESLSLQLKHRGIWDEIYESLLENLEKIAEGQIEDLCVKLHIGQEEFLERFLEIKTCNPRLTRGFSFEKVCHIIPDFRIYQEGDSYQIQENPNLQNNLYRMDMKETRELNLLRRCIEKRVSTLQKILSYLVEKQKDYIFFSGEKRTLHEQEVAEFCDLHISTVSRAIQNKYFQYQEKVFSFKTLFCYSQDRERIKKLIKFLLEMEDKKQPYSDDTLVQILIEKYHYDIARRTVAKYRRDMGYGSSFVRVRK